MLVLSRKLGERVLVPQCGMSVTVVAIEGNVVRLGFNAPSEVGVYRCLAVGRRWMGADAVAAPPTTHRPEPHRR